MPSGPKVIVPSDAELEHFNSIPWAKRLLQESLREGSSRSNYVAIEMPSRTLKYPSSDEDGYMAGTLATAETIPFMLTLRRRNLDAAVATNSLPSKPPQSVSDPKSTRAPSFTPSRPPDMITLISLSTPGVSGHPGTAHGGVVAAMFDEVMYLTAEAQTLSSSSSSSSSSLPPQSMDAREDEGSKIYTAQLSVRFRKPIYTPGLLVLRSWCIARSGRKCWTLAHAVQEEQGDCDDVGDTSHLEKALCSEASALWIITRDEKL